MHYILGKNSHKFQAIVHARQGITMQAYGLNTDLEANKYIYYILPNSQCKRSIDCREYREKWK